MAPHQEIEVKLRVDPEKMAEIRRSRWWRELGPVRRQSLHSVYFDTSDRQLRDCSISLRTRSDGKTVIQTVKMARGASDSVSRREWETLIPDPIPDPSLVIDPALPAGLPQAHLGRPAPGLRRRRQTGDASPGIGAGADRHLVGRRRRHRGTGTRKAIHEIELELIAGELEELFAEARRLSDAVDGRLHARTKADVGYALTSDRPQALVARAEAQPHARHDRRGVVPADRPQRVFASDRKRRLRAAQSARRRRASVPHRTAATAFRVQDLRSSPAPQAHRADRRTKSAGSGRSWGRRAISTSCRPTCSSPPSRRSAKRSNWLRSWPAWKRRRPSRMRRWAKHWPRRATATF